MMGVERGEWIIFGIIYLSIFIRLNVYGDQTADRPHCDKKRVILTDKVGIIEDYKGKKKDDYLYKPFSRCEWLIDAGSSRKSIYLEFLSMETECSYDFIFIFDGNSYNSTLLASVSGCTIPQPIIARSGYMLVYFFTDRNYNLKGFKAQYKVQDCPADCYNNGFCFDHKCACRAGFGGEDCRFQNCPNDCNMGDCLKLKCHCDIGYAGVECDMPIKKDEGKSSWYTLAPPDGRLTARTSHTMVLNKERECLYVFGGFTLSAILGDLMRFCIVTNVWEMMKRSEPWPSGRKEHTMLDFGAGFYVFGGMLSNGTHCNELWYFNYSSGAWAIKARNSSVTPAGLTGHTMTSVDNWIYVIGGKLQNGLFSSVIYRYDTNNTEEVWEEVSLTGGRTMQRLLVGHSAVYHKETRSILIYGGYSALQARYAKLSGRIFVFNVDTHYWGEVFYKDHKREQYRRAYHSAVIMGNYMVVYGGNIHIHNLIEVCYDAHIHLYHLGCHQWIKHPLQNNYGDPLSCSGEMLLPTESEKGRFGHAAVTGYGNILFISGGYSGSVRGDLIAYKFPAVVAPPESDLPFDKDYCIDYKDGDICKKDPECIFCDKRKDSDKPGCVHRTRAEICFIDIRHHTHAYSCAGICGALKTCQTCLTYGQGVTLTSEAPTRRFYQEKCIWCVKNSTCQRRAVPEGTCSRPDGTPLGIRGWWNSLSARWTEVEQCAYSDAPAGIQMLTYYEPANITQPDEVTLLKTFSTDISYNEAQRKNIKDEGNMVIIFRGYIHPLNAQPYYRISVKLFVTSSGLMYSFRLSNDSTMENLEEVASQNKSHGSMRDKQVEARRNGSLPILPYTQRGYKYYFTIRATKRLKDNVNLSLSLHWNCNYTGRKSRPFTMEFLEPFHEGRCRQYHNCLYCLTDVDCGWCPATGTCDHRGDNSSLSSCIGPNAEKYLVTMPGDCAPCEDHVDCMTCTRDSLCEWFKEQEKCTRRYRFNNTIRNQTECPLPCEERSDCTACISQGKNECFWCENTQTCLPFAHYVSRFLHGQCREWVDSEGITTYKCNECSEQKTCEYCLATYGCGWCGSSYNPRIGNCVRGDFAGPAGGNCSIPESSTYSIIDTVQGLHDTVQWSYQSCPDVNECILNLHNCHENATCNNIDGAFECKCKRGYEGDGVRVCNKTCYYECVHGHCVGFPDYQCKCDLGYTSEDCNTSCECNNQSTCSKGVGICDSCQHYTTGLHCESCLPGYYGEPSYMFGCSKCQCNGHGVESLGFCNGTGHCFCTDNTVGKHCEGCEPYYYGNSENGGKCYRSCDNPTILNSTSGYLGSHKGSGVTDWHAYCVWIISPFTSKLVPAVAKIQYETPTINVTIEDIDADCGWDYVYVYDGIPDFIDGSAEATGTLLGVFCGNKPGQFVVAKSRIVTVYFETDISALHHKIPGFNASYHVNDCPTDCPIDKVCVGKQCVCESGQGGEECGSYVCPRNCHINVKSKLSCICETNFDGGANYTVEISPWFFPAMPRITGHIGQRNRYGHTLISCGDDTLYMFGGFSLEKGLLNDLWEYTISEDRWALIGPITIDIPDGRYYHAAACVPYVRQLYIFGGIIQDRNNKSKYTVTKELWRFAIGGRKWKRMSVPAKVQPVAGHTMTQIADTKLLIIGGFSAENYFSDTLLEYDVNEEFVTAWHEYKRNDLQGAVPLGLYGHSAVYHQGTNSIYVYGGMVYHIDRFRISDELYVLNLDNDRKHWNVLQAEEGSQKNTRYLHAAVDMGDYMVVIGGRTDKGNFSDTIMVYRYLCNFWHTFPVGDTAYSMPLHSVLAPSATAVNGSIYLMGGLDNLIHSEVFKLDLPSDVCSLIGDLDVCVNATGCSACQVAIPTQPNKTYCYSNDRSAPPICEEPYAKTIKGVQCSLQWHLEKNCLRFKTCSHCLSVFPHFKEDKQTCMWCKNCPVGKCIPLSHDCKLNCSGNEAQYVKEPELCMAYSCTATDCDKCRSNQQCMWSQSRKRKSDGKLILGDPPGFEWGCFSRATDEDSSPPKVCPDRCHMNTNCTHCLKSSGAEGGSKECIWSDMLQECMSPAYRALQCAGGECGLIIQGSHTKCPRPCTTHKWCSDCLAAPGCGWCAIGGLNGRGVCLKGGVKNPINGSCDEINGVVPGQGEVLSAEDRERIRRGLGSPQWVFTECLGENECENGHHDCDENRQNCIDLPVGYRCECKTGYVWKEEKGMCEPVCHQGCISGVCDLPDHCTCNFGYVGKNCGVECDCNGHSNCESEKNRANCTKCVNNTQGKQCEECKVTFVGDPRGKGTCTSCHEFCHNHTRVCVSLKLYHNQSHIIQTKEYASDYDIARAYSHRGPVKDDAMCLKCRENTIGQMCEHCLDGYFRVEKEGKTKFDRCDMCQCHGHSDTCDKKSGLHCACSNHTESPCPNQKDKDSTEKCWQKQCSACKEYFLGTPTNDHHCYRQMTVDKDYCFDPVTQNNCNQNPGPLLRGRTIFFAVQPRYLNVDIRVTIDVTLGGVDIYFSSSDQTFITQVRKHDGFHQVMMDRSFKDTGNHRYSRTKRSVRSVNNGTSGERHDLIEFNANSFHTYHTVKQTKTILIVHNVQSRIVITLPLELGLKTSKFYIIMLGTGSDSSNLTFGNLYFRQDQTHIDLFVFFSVFFSSFFLFLAMCVLLWKLKQAVDAQRSRRERAAEMMHMASRPFARVLILIEPDPMPFASTPLPRRTKHLKLTVRGNQPTMPLPPVETLQIQPRYLIKEEHPFEIVPMAMEPTEDGVASVRTVMFQLPGGPAAPTKLCLGSGLTLSSRAAMMGTKVASRRRPSSSVC